MERRYALESEWITVKEAAKIGYYHPEYVRHLMRRKQITGRKFGSVWQVKKSSLLAYIAGSPVKTVREDTPLMISEMDPQEPPQLTFIDNHTMTPFIRAIDDLGNIQPLKVDRNGYVTLSAEMIDKMARRVLELLDE